MVIFDAFEKIKFDIKKVIREKSQILLLVAQEAVLNKLREIVEGVTLELQKSVIDSLRDIKPILKLNTIPTESFNVKRNENLEPIRNKQDKTKHIPRYECLQCGKNYSQKHNLLKHRK